MRLLLQLFLVFAFALPANTLFATHNQGGEIIFRKTGPLTVEAQIVTYTRAQSVAADRDTLTLCWGDGQCQRLARSNGPNGSGELITPDIKRNIYIATHTYAQADRYWLSMTDPNRNGGILNVNFPNSDNIPFHLQAMVNFLPEADASVHSPVLLELPIDAGTVGRPFFHTPNAFDKDGDSIVYALVTPLMDLNTPVSGYQMPTSIAPGSDNALTLDPQTGLVAWQTPQQPGAYVIAIEIRTYRDDVLLEVVTRDMLIEINAGFNSPPKIELGMPNPGVVQTVYVGDTVQLSMLASDPDAGQILSLSSTCGLYDFFQDTASFSLFSPNSAIFTWVVRAEHVRQAPYQLDFKATDDGTSGSALAVFEVLRYRVLQTSSTNPDLKQTMHVQVYPNPFTNTTTLRLPQAAPDGFRLGVSDARGRMVMEKTVPAGAEQLQIDLSGMPPAFYFLQILGPQRQVLGVARLVKQTF